MVCPRLQRLKLYSRRKLQDFNGENEETEALELIEHVCCGQIRSSRASLGKQTFQKSGFQASFETCGSAQTSRQHEHLVA
ncbi:hypothetical protein INR49_004981 [Caranx melampygus]|nr:hypothetical protein INR49_004981 [Caranx melampygus]